MRLLMKQQDIWMRLLQVTDIIRELHHKENLEERPPLHTTIAEAKVMHCVLFSKTNGCSVKEIAERLGYRSPLYFSTAFRRTFGLSPSRYRLQNRESWSE